MHEPICAITPLVLHQSQSLCKMIDDGTMLKWSSLVMLTAQNFAFGLLMPLSRVKDAQGNVYFGPTSVATTEACKIVIALAILLVTRMYTPAQQEQEQGKQAEMREVTNAAGYVQVPMQEHDGDGDLEQVEPMTWKRAIVAVKADVFNAAALRMALPAALFVIQNNLQILSAGYLSPAEFQVFSQLKLVTTAVFAYLLLKQKLNVRHWLSIAALCAGVVMVKGMDKSFTRASLTQDALWLVGVPSIVGACIVSGLSGVLIEVRLKGRSSNFWATNVQLSLFSLPPAILPIVLDTIHRKAFEPFRFFNSVVWICLFVNVAGGLLVAMVVKYADNILKGFSVSIAMLLTILFSSMATQQPLHPLQLVGGFVVAASAYAYGRA